MVRWEDSEARLELTNEWESLKGHLNYAKEYAKDVFWGAMPEKVQKKREETHPGYNAVRATSRSSEVEFLAGVVGVCLPYASITLGTLALLSGLNRYEEAERKGNVNGSIFVAGPYKAYDGSLLSRKS